MIWYVQGMVVGKYKFSLLKSLCFCMSREIYVYSKNPTVPILSFWSEPRCFSRWSLALGSLPAWAVQPTCSIDTLRPNRDPAARNTYSWLLFDFYLIIGYSASGEFYSCWLLTYSVIWPHIVWELSPRLLWSSLMSTVFMDIEGSCKRMPLVPIPRKLLWKHHQSPGVWGQPRHPRNTWFNNCRGKGAYSSIFLGLPWL